MQELEVTWGRILRFWWAFFWRGVVIAVPIGAVIGALLGATVAMMGHPEWVHSPWFRLGSAVIWLPIVPIVLRMAFRKKYSDFRIAFVSLEPPPVV
jgi:hypothetical protein